MNAREPHTFGKFKLKGYLLHLLHMRDEADARNDATIDEFEPLTDRGLQLNAGSKSQLPSTRLEGGVLKFEDTNEGVHILKTRTKNEHQLVACKLSHLPISRLEAGVLKDDFEPHTGPEVHLQVKAPKTDGVAKVCV